MIRHLAICVVFTIAASSCYGQDQKIPFLQMERDNSLSLQQGWSESVDGLNFMAADSLPDSLFEPGYRRNNSAKVQSPRRERVIDAKFLIANGSSVAMTFMDYATTRHCLAAHECTEGNPLMPTSLGGMVLMGVVSDGTISVYSYMLKRRHLGATWVIAPVGNAGLHVWGMYAGLKSW